jgi:hypothetical protein
MRTIKIVFELAENLQETVDEDGDACETLNFLPNG